MKTIVRIIGAVGLLVSLFLTAVEILGQGFLTKVSIAIGLGRYGGWELLVSFAVIYGVMFFHGLPRRSFRPTPRR